MNSPTDSMKDDMELVMENKDQVMNELESSVPVIDQETSLVELSLDGVEEVADNNLDAAIDNVEDLGDNVQELVEDLGDNVQELVEDNLKKAVDKEIEDIKEVVNEVAQDAKDKIDEAVENTNNVMSEITEYVDDFSNPKSLEQKNVNELESSMAETDASPETDAPKKKSFVCRWFGFGC